MRMNGRDLAQVEQNPPLKSKKTERKNEEIILIEIPFRPIRRRT